MTDIKIDFSLVNAEGLSKPATKLIDVVAGFIGAALEPTRIRREAKAHADATVIRTRAAAECADIAARAATRLDAVDLYRQRNIENIVGAALPQLPASVSDEQPEPDWIAHFFSQCQDVSDGQMQILWSKLLAGEISSPGRYSLRSLDIVRTLRKDEAQLFAQICAYALRAAEEFVYFDTLNSNDYLKRKGITFSEWVTVNELGLVDIHPTLRWTFNDPAHANVSYFGETFGTRAVGGRTRTLSFYRFTRVGNELAAISGASADIEYLNVVVEDLSQHGLDLIPV